MRLWINMISAFLVVLRKQKQTTIIKKIRFLDRFNFESQSQKKTTHQGGFSFGFLYQFRQAVTRNQQPKLLGECKKWAFGITIGPFLFIISLAGEIKAETSHWEAFSRYIIAHDIIGIFNAVGDLEIKLTISYRRDGKLNLQIAAVDAV